MSLALRKVLPDWLDFLLSPSLRRDAFLSVLVTLLFGMAALHYAIGQLDRQSALAELLNSAGRLRYLSQRIAYAAHRAADKEPNAQARVQEFQEEFEARLAMLESRGRDLGLFSDPEHVSSAALRQLKSEWPNFRELTLHLTREAPYRQISSAEIEQLAPKADVMLDLSDALVEVTQVQFVEKRDQVRYLPPALVVLGILLTLSTFLYNHFRIRRPLERIGKVFGRIASGDFSTRIEKGWDDEFGALIERINQNIETLQKLKEDQAESEKAIRDSESRNRTLWEVSTDAIIIIGADGVIRHTNPAVLQVFGYKPHEIEGRDIGLLQPKQLQERHQRGLRSYLESRKRRIDWARIELTALHRSGREIPVELSFAHMVLAGEDWFVGFFRDVSQRVEALADLRIRDRAIESTSEGVMIVDARTSDYPIIYVNPALERITGYCAEEAIGQSSRMFFGDDDGQIASLLLLVREGKEGTLELSARRRNGDGAACWVELSLAPVNDAAQEISHYVIVFKDITERKRQEAALLRSATCDALTGLPNRSLLYDRLRQTIVSAHRFRREVGVLFVDLDHFKRVNDSFGHDLGDQLLSLVATRLTSCLRDGDTVARWGGDEFVILLADLDVREDIVAVARRILEILRKPVQLGDREIYCEASIGGSVFPKDGETAEILLQHADVAMYRAKEQGRNGYRLYAQDMQDAIDRRLSLETQLRKAIENGELSLHFQPQIDLASSRVIGAEALVRWTHPQIGMVSPALFIPLAEESDLIIAIGEWVLHSACAEMRHWKELGLRDIRVAVNFSARQFLQPDLPAQVVSTLECHGLQAADIEVEITENMVMSSPTRTIDTLRQLTALGIRSALDDFGTGYSNLAYLKNFPIDTLKIDKSFVQDKDIVRAIIQLATNYKLQTIAEGVEDAGTVEMLQTLGCDIVQGYYYSRPLPAGQFVEFVQGRSDAAKRS